MVEELARRDISMTYFAIKGQEYHAFMLPGVEGEHVVPLDDFAWGPIPEPPEDEAVQAKKKNKTRTKKRNASRKKKDVSE
jgi:hypothetical protein